MYRKNPQYTTPIEELPDLEDIEPHRQAKNMAMTKPGFSGTPGVVPENKYTKFLRNSHVVPSESGMSNGQPSYEQQYLDKLNDMKQPEVDREPYHPVEQQRVYNSNQEHNNMNNNMNFEQQFRERYEPPKPEITCIDVANHIEKCPLCSKFYNNDKTVYIIAIVLLSIICLLLLKKVLNV